MKAVQAFILGLFLAIASPLCVAPVDEVFITPIKKKKKKKRVANKPQPYFARFM